jgi:hypothetical protein
VFLPLLPPPRDRAGYRAYLDQLRQLTEGLPPTLMVWGMAKIIHTNEE